MPQPGPAVPSIVSGGSEATGGSEAATSEGSALGDTSTDDAGTTEGLGWAPRVAPGVAEARCELVGGLAVQPAATTTAIVAMTTR